MVSSGFDFSACAAKPSTEDAQEKAPDAIEDVPAVDAADAAPPDAEYSSDIDSGDDLDEFVTVATEVEEGKAALGSEVKASAETTKDLNRRREARRTTGPTESMSRPTTATASGRSSSLVRVIVLREPPIIDYI